MILALVILHSNCGGALWLFGLLPNLQCQIAQDSKSICMWNFWEQILETCCLVQPVRAGSGLVGPIKGESGGGRW